MKSASTDRQDPTFIGCSNSWSSHPLVQELEKYAPRFQLVRDDGAGLNKKLEQGEVAMAFCPSISLVRHADFEMALPVGVAVEGGSALALWGLSNHHMHLKNVIDARIDALRDVFRWAQFHKTENLKQAMTVLQQGLAGLPVPRLETLPTMRLTPSASSWNVLARVLYRLIFGSEAYDSLQRLCNGSGHNWTGGGEDGPSLDLRIENEALQKRCSFRHYYDLGEMWRSITGLPFVANVLQKNRRNAANCRSSLAEVLELAQMRMQVEPCNYLPDILPRNCQQQSIDLCSMWKGVHYRLSGEDLRGLLVFLSLAKPIEKKAVEDESFTLKMLRWQQREGFMSGQLA
jgi:predicted solute-binding protein